jgi:hypothetical protein
MEGLQLICFQTFQFKKRMLPLAIKSFSGKMKDAIPILILLLTSSLANATNYYLSSSLGSDLNDGKTPNTAWQSIPKLKTVLAVLQPGDSVFFKRNDTYTGQLVLSKSGNVTSVELI